MADIFRGAAHNFAAADFAQLHRIVRDEAVSALDELDGRFAFAHAGIAQNEDAFAVDLHQHAMARDAGSKLGVQRGNERAHQRACHFVGKQ